MPPKTQEQISMEEITKMQNEESIKEQKWEARRKAVDIAGRFAAPDAEQMLTQANKVYEWLIQDLT